MHGKIKFENDIVDCCLPFVYDLDISDLLFVNDNQG